eukprot:CAMPEP_0174251100 /NCGR_PEP_ID=MMETSP0439-20130205/1043_1 /TAXON_ID=0 /ORGANISM="Stereomyxa ramosa, Strain Chinc5" /LENGTH=100 /DNA_ID=CAMNT_0015331335 /DNA_START=41 /DNA_END=340 /DNA_ORIENTATION=+
MNTSDAQELVNKFQKATGADQSQSLFFLEASGWHFSRALKTFDESVNSDSFSDEDVSEEPEKISEDEEESSDEESEEEIPQKKTEKKQTPFFEKTPEEVW